MINEERFSKEDVERATEKIKLLSNEELLFFTIWYYYGVSYNAGDEYIEIYKKFHDIFEISFKIDFDDLFSKFINEKVLEGDGGSEYLSELYETAFEKCLKENKRINDFFSKLILSRLEVDRGYQIDDIGLGIIAKNFNVLLKEVQDLFVKVADEGNEDLRARVAGSILWYYYSIPSDVRDSLLNKLIRDTDLISKSILDTMYFKFGDLPPDFRENVIVELDYPFRIIGKYFNDLPIEIQDQFRERIKLSFKISFLGYKIKQSERKNAIYAIVNSFENLPEDIQEMLWLFTDDKSPSVRSTLGRILETQFNNLPSNMREMILRKLSEDIDYEVRRFIAPAIIRNFSQLPSDFSDILEKLVMDKNVLVRSLVAYSLNFLDNIKNVPSGLRDTLLKKLLLDEDLCVIENAASSIVINFGSLQKETQDFFRGLAKTGNLEVRKSIAYAVAYNYRIEDTRGLIEILLPELEEKIEDLVKTGWVEHKEKVISILNNTKEKIRKEFAIEILEKLSKDDDGYFRNQAIKMLPEFK